MLILKKCQRPFIFKITLFRVETKAPKIESMIKKICYIMYKINCYVLYQCAPSSQNCAISFLTTDK